ncbi:3-deoxy-D-manno-octulosonate cytidylyltransferase [Halobacteriovorax marinus]|uniref:3-deoxy-manno-octulosonate cytidylyltransferase n=1 Tax=Halobacteriovorax marinus TaxID=97084 RepID=UPI000BC2FACE|nr:3-deoxy-manno-octulosonate cytidylyltransferase [Halobacteriovorax marinus]ATH08627.1 3-deoxy-D-manno-octulosonate cytidylyltransferase [Halobacteriovorax marinus]
MNELRVLILIPARYASSRFPGKPLAKISKKSMIQRVYENCLGIKDQLKNSVVCVVTDDERIEEHVLDFGGEVVRVDDDVASGSERIALALERFYSDTDWDFVVNVQGDEPLIESDLLSRLASYHEQSSFDIATVVKPFHGHEAEHIDANKVKAIYSPINGQCLYFSRAELPFYRDSVDIKDWFLHIGIYSYRPEVLKKFCKLSPSRYELIEKLEQLRALENGFTMGAVTTDMTLMGVDVPEDIEKLEGVLRERKIKS